MRTYKNAKAVISQIKRREWEPSVNSFGNQIYAAEREGRTLWVGNGGFFCDVDESNAFGFLFRHWVWFYARKLAKTEKIKLY